MTEQKTEKTFEPWREGDHDDLCGLWPESHGEPH